MKKKNITFILGIFLVVFITGFASAIETNYSINYNYDGVQITLLNYEPDIANPGEYFDVWIHASLGSSVNYAKFTLLDSFPFSVDQSENPVREYKGTSSRDVVMHYKARVDEDAVEGSNELKIQVITSTLSTDSQIYPFEIYVEDVQTDFDLVIQDSSSSEISLALANVGKNTANSMIVRIPEQDSYSISGTNGQMVGNLDSGDYTIVSFELSQTPKKSESGLIVQIDYTDSIGERRSVTKEINLGSGSVIGNTSTGEMPEDFEEMVSQRRGFPGQQQQTAKWPYVLAGVIIFAGIVFFSYHKNPKKFRQFFTKLKKDSKNKKEKEIKLNIPEWITKEKEKAKR